ncbi:hypothetical protein [Pradoshia sp.]
MELRDKEAKKDTSINISPVIKDYIQNKTTLEDLEQLKHLIAKRYAILKVPGLD